MIACRTQRMMVALVTETFFPTTLEAHEERAASTATWRAPHTPREALSI